MIDESAKIERIIEEWCDKEIFDPHTELVCRIGHSIVKESERTNLLLLELINRTVEKK